MSDDRYVNIGPPEVKLMEECAEVIQEVSKAYRFGWNDWHPKDPSKTNITRVKDEMQDVIDAWNSMVSRRGLFLPLLMWKPNEHV